MILRYFVIYDSFEFVEFKTIPVNITSAFTHFLYIFSLVFIIFTNYVAFYFLVKKYFREAKNNKGNQRRSEIVLKFNDSKLLIPNKEIEDFFKSFKKGSTLE